MLSVNWRTCSPGTWWLDVDTMAFRTSAPRIPPTGSMSDPSQARIRWTSSVGRTKLCRGPLKSLVKLGDVVLPQKSIGGFHTRDLVQS